MSASPETRPQLPTPAELFSAEQVTSKNLTTMRRTVPVGAAITLINFSVFTLVAWDLTDQTILLGWLSVSAVLLIGVAILSVRNAKSPNEAQVSRARYYETLIATALFIAPTVAMPLLFLGGGQPTVDVMVLCITAGAAVIGPFLLCRIPVAAAIYTFPINLSVILACLSYASSAYWPIAVFTIPYIGYLYFMLVVANFAGRDRERQYKRAQEANEQLQIAFEELHRLREAAEREAIIDELTGLHNRRGLVREFERLQSEAADRGLALLHVDLDRFKEINDTLGHGAGDQVLRLVAKALRNSVRETDFVARVGGDEFVILAALDGGRASIEHIAERIVGALRDPITIEGAVCRFGASVGVDLSQERRDLDTMLRNADRALYQAKENGRGHARFYNPQTVGSIRAAEEMVSAEPSRH